MSGESNPPHASASPAPGSNTNPQSDDCETDGKPAPSACSSEEARKLRQAQQKLQKEKWQRKYGLGSKRHSEGSVGGESFPEQAPHNKGQTADEGCFNELISDGKLCCVCTAWFGPLNARFVHSMHGFCVAGNTTSITQLKIECEVHGAFNI